MAQLWVAETRESEKTQVFILQAAVCDGLPVGVGARVQGSLLLLSLQNVQWRTAVL